MKKISKMVSLVLCFILIFGNISIAKVDINIYSKAYISYERNTKTVLFGKDIDKKIPMASTTKIMTAILLLEYGKLDEYVITSKNAQNTNGQQLNFKEGDKISLNDLLYAIMLYSANDGAVAIAEHIGGSIENFCNMMNEKAKSIGAYNTNFTSPHGLDNENHYSTAYDLAIITDYALNIPKFKQVTSTKEYSITINESIKNIRNTNRLLYTDESITGIKTGYTNNAMYCLVANKKVEDKDIISVVLGSNTSNQRFDETKKILDYSINNYKIVDLKNYLKEKIDVDILKSKERKYIIRPVNISKICILNENINNIKTEYSILKDIEAPVNKNTIIGVSNIYINENTSVKVEYKLDDDVLKIGCIDYFVYIITNLQSYLKLR